jgi:hypothetical protein
MFHEPFDLSVEGYFASEMFYAIENYKKHPAELVREKYQASFDDVQMIPLHKLPPSFGKGNDPILGYLFCHQLAGFMPHTCQAVKNGTIGASETETDLVPEVSSMLADKAYQKGMIETTSKRLDVSARVKDELASNTLLKESISMSCLSDKMLTRFEQLSLHVERRLFPSNRTAWNSDHQLGFLDFVKRRQHCHIDPDLTLENEKWVEFFQQWGNPNLPVPAGGATNVDQDRKDKLPTFLLHIGIHKTGTSYLQSALCGKDAKEVHEVLSQDNFTYLGTGPDRRYCLYHNHRTFIMEDMGRSALSVIQKMIVKYPNQTTSRGSSNLNPTFIAKVQALREKGHSAMVVFEDMSGFNHGHVKAMADFLQKNWNVKVLVAYRSLHEWLPSVQNQRNKGLLGAKAWRTNLAHQPFDLDVDSYTSTQMFNAIEKHKKHPTELVRDKFRLYFDDVEMIPLHQLSPTSKKGDPLLGYIFCRLLAGLTPHTCNAIENGTIGNNGGYGNPTESLAFNMLADVAFKKGLISANHKRQDVSARIRQEVEFKNLTEYDFPLKCTSNEKLNRLERLSLDVERGLFLNNRTSDDAHHESFLNFLANLKHCHVDAEKALKEERWVSFFQEEFPPPESVLGELVHDGESESRPL